MRYSIAAIRRPALLVSLGLLVALLLPGCGDGGQTAGSLFPHSALYALSPTQLSVSRYSLITNSLTLNLLTLPSGAQPTDLAVRLGKGYLLDAATRTLRVFTTADGEPLKEINLGATVSPQRVRPYTDTIAYVTDSANGALLVVDLNAETVTPHTLGGAPQAITFALGKMYVTNTAGTGSVTVVSVGSYNILNTINLSTAPLAVASDGRGQVHVLTAGTDTDAQARVYRINTHFDVVSGAPLLLGADAVDLVRGEDDRGYAPAHASATLGTPAGVIVYDWSTGNLLYNGVPVEVGATPGSAVALSGKRVAVADQVTGQVHVIGQSPTSAPLTTFDRPVSRLVAE